LVLFKSLRKILIVKGGSKTMAGWETYEPPETKKESKNAGKWLLSVLAVILFVNIFVVEMALL
tara:strand:+ start:1973 stop:2161 length:189 start_codon:yes stop_codon:yes gene_type:complete